jgi:two-component system response regulator
VIREVLERCGFNYQLCVAEDGQHALECLEEFSIRSACPALILLDLNLPKIDGIEVLRRLREASRCRLSPVVVVTSSDSEADRAAVESLGAQAYFRKPLELSEYMKLSQVIRSVLQCGPPS